MTGSRNVQICNFSKSKMYLFKIYIFFKKTSLLFPISSSTNCLLCLYREWCASYLFLIFFIIKVTVMCWFASDSLDYACFCCLLILSTFILNFDDKLWVTLTRVHCLRGQITETPSGINRRLRLVLQKWVTLMTG